MLLDAVVQLTLDPAAVGIGGQDEPPAGCMQAHDFRAKSVERLCRFGVRGFQGRSTSCPVAR